MTEEVIDMQVFNELKDTLGDDYIYELLVTLFEEAPKNILEMTTAFSNGDADTFRRSAHTLKSNAQSFGATSLWKLCNDLEKLARQGQLNQVEDMLDTLQVEYQKAVDALKGIHHE